MKKFFTALLLIMIMTAALPLESAGQTASPGANDSNDEIHISADRLIAHGQNEYAEFTGNVRATSTELDITADNLKIFYEKSPTAETAGTVTNKAFSRIIATGHVVIRTPGKIAKTDKAVYNKSQNKIILTGAGSMVTGESGYIAGETIIMHTDSESVTVESGQKQRVEAVINTEQTESGQKQDDKRP